MPNAHYLVTVRDSNTGVSSDIHLQIKNVVGGRWDGYVLVNMYGVGGELIPVPDGRERDALLSLVRRGYNGSGGFRRNMLRFGTERGLCPICYRPLTDPKEKRDGVHKNPECYQIAFG
jgi:hypothetical protein